MTILELIQTQCRAVNISDKYAEKIQKLFKIEKEEGIGNYVQMFKDNILSDIETAEKATKTVISEYEKKHGLKDGKPVEEEKKTDVDVSKLSPEVKAILDAQTKQIGDLTDLVKGLTTTVATSQKEGSAKSLFDNSKLPAKWFSRIDVNSEKSIEEQIKDLQTEYSEIQQSIIENAVENGDYKPRTGAPKERTEAEWAKLMEGEGANEKDSGTVDLGL